MLGASFAAGGRRVRLEITGHADSDGPSQSNDPLSERRAEQVRAAFDPDRLQAVDIVTRGVGSREPIGPSIVEVDKERNRRVSLRVLPPVDAQER